MEAIAESGTEERIERRHRLILVLIPIGVFTVVANVGSWFGPAIVSHHPLLQMWLNPTNRYLALAANRVDPVHFYGLGFLRLVITDPFFYLLGLWYGDRALAWMKRRSLSSARLIERVERWFARFRYPIVFLAPNGIVCLLAGATEMPVLPFALLNVAGTITRLVVIKLLAHVFTGPLAATNRFIDRYQWWLVGLSIAVAVWQFQRRRRDTAQSRSPVHKEAADSPG
jgi:membrane protein DedA with SNARE-associated domain